MSTLLDQIYCILLYYAKDLPGFDSRPHNEALKQARKCDVEPCNNVTLVWLQTATFQTQRSPVSAIWYLNNCVALQLLW